MVQLHHGHLVLEALLLVRGDHLEVQVGTRCERGVQPIDAVVDTLIVHQKLRAGDHHFLLNAFTQQQVQGVDRLRALVAHGHFRHALQAALLRHQINGESDVGVVRLQDTVVLLVGLLVIGCVILLLITTGDLVQHFRVVVVPRAKADPQGEHRQGQPLAVLHARHRQAATDLDPRFLAAYPEEQGEHQQYACEGQPIRPEPEPALQRSTVCVHVGIRDARDGVEAHQIAVHVE